MITIESAKNMTWEQLLYARKDLGEVIRVQEDSAKQGYHCPKLFVYWDEMHAVVGEIFRRRNQ